MNRRYFKPAIAVLCVVIVLSSCKAKKQTISAKKAKTDSAVLIQKVKSTGIDYNTIEIKGSAKTEIDDKKYNFSIIYRNVKDQEIWVSVRAMLGIEVARMKCTPEEVRIFSRMADINESGDWSKMAEFLGYPIDYYTFQGMMTRNLFIPFKNSLEDLTGYISRNSQSGLLMVPDYNNKSFIEQRKDVEFWPQFLIDSEDFYITKTRIVPTGNDWQFEADYGKGSSPGLGGLSDRFTLRATDEGQDLELSINVQSVIINQELKMPYSW
jgi:hypothetical protein